MLALTSRAASQRRVVCAAAIAWGVAACAGGRGGDGPTGAGAVPRSLDQVALDGTLAPGLPARLTGLAAVEASRLRVTLDGQPVAVSPDGLGAVRFTVPVTGCEADGRPVVIGLAMDAATRTLVAPITLAASAAPAELRVGASRLLTTSELGCVQLARGAAQFALLVLSTDTDTMRAGIVRLQVRGDSGAPLAISLATASGDAGAAVSRRALAWTRDGDASVLAPVGGERMVYAASVTPTRVAVDPRLARAQPGDHVLLPASASQRTSPWTCLSDGVTAQTVDYTVVAVSGRVVVVAPSAGARLADLQARTTGLTEAARLVDQYGLAALQRLLGVGVDWYPTAGGRVVVALTPLDGLDAGGVPYGYDNYTHLRCPNSAELNAVLVNEAVALGPRDVREVAGVAVHEFAHVFDQYADRSTGVGNPGSSAGWAAEGLAESAREILLRLAEAGDGVPLVTGRAGLLSGLSAPWSADWITQPGAEGWSPFGRAGRYELGAKLLLAAREKAGDAGLAPAAAGATLYERMVRRLGPGGHDWTPAALAVDLGLAPADLLDWAATAVTTDDAVDPMAAAAEGLPQLSGWDNRDSWPLAFRNVPARRVAAGAARDETLAIGGGGYVARYLETSDSRGLAARLTLSGTSNTLRVRLIRLR